MPSHYQGSQEEIQALNTFIKLTRAYESVSSRLSAENALQNLTVSQFGVLEILFHLGPLCQGEISSKLLKSGGNVTFVVDNLVKSGLVDRQRSQEDRRQVFVSLTDAGRELIQQVLPEQVAAITRVMSALTMDEMQILGALLKKLGTAS